MRVYVDTNTLYPFYLCDLLLRCAEEDLFDLLWTEYLLAELVDVLPRSGRRDREAVERLCDLIRQMFPRGEIVEADYRQLVGEMPGPDPDDWPHSAAAIVGGADVLLTRDKKGFPAAPLARRGLRITNADEFLCEQFAHYPDDLVRVLRNQVSDLTRLRLTLDRLLGCFDHSNGTPRFVALVRAHL